jgi:hypothetical protein
MVRLSFKESSKMAKQQKEVNATLTPLQTLAAALTTAATGKVKAGEARITALREFCAVEATQALSEKQTDEIRTSILNAYKAADYTPGSAKVMASQDMSFVRKWASNETATIDGKEVPFREHQAGFNDVQKAIKKPGAPATASRKASGAGAVTLPKQFQDFVNAVIASGKSGDSVWLWMSYNVDRVMAMAQAAQEADLQAAKAAGPKPVEQDEQVQEPLKQAA